MKAPIRAALLGAILAMSVAAPVVAAPASTIHESVSTCRTDDVTGFTYCFESETDRRTKEKHGGASDVKTSGVIHFTVLDADGNLVSSYDSTIRERDLAQLASNGSVAYTRITIRLSEEITDAGVTSCTRTHLVIRGGAEKVNEVTTTPGPC